MDIEKMRSSYEDEATAHSKYKLYEEKAREEGLEQIAELFAHNGKNELGHAELWMNRINELGTTEENLRKAIADEEKSSEAYAGWYAQEKDPVLKALSNVEKGHAAELRHVLEELENSTLYETPETSVWECSNCGFHAMGRKAPLHCPLCAYQQGCFIKEN